jgi:hypothetical protein
VKAMPQLQYARTQSRLRANPHVTAVFAVDTVLDRIAYAILSEMGRGAAGHGARLVRRSEASLRAVYPSGHRHHHGQSRRAHHRADGRQVRRLLGILCI